MGSNKSIKYGGMEPALHVDLEIAESSDRLTINLYGDGIEEEINVDPKGDVYNTIRQTLNL